VAGVVADAVVNVAVAVGSVVVAGAGHVAVGVAGVVGVVRHVAAVVGQRRLETRFHSATGVGSQQVVASRCPAYLASEIAQAG